MNLLETLLSSENGAVIGQIAKATGLGESDARSAVGKLAPALSRGITNNVRKPGGLEALMGALQSGSHGRYVDRPELMGREETVTEGNAILGHILGTKDVSRNVAGHAAQETGLDAGILKKMLPMVATAVMGTMGKQSSLMGALGGQQSGGQQAGGQSSGGQSSGGGLLGSLLGGGGQAKDSGMAGIVEGFLDSDKDGAVVDDLLSMAKKFI